MSFFDSHVGVAQCCTTGSVESDSTLAASIETEVHRHGGRILATFLLVMRPDLRKRLGDLKLLRFLAKFPDQFLVRDVRPGGHQIVARRLVAGYTPSTQGAALAQAPIGATMVRGAAVFCERAVHALRSLERELVRRLAFESELDSGHLDRDALVGRWRAKDVSWLLRNGKVRRKLGAAIRYHPVLELIACEECGAQESKLADSGARIATETDEATQPRHRCPVTLHARTYAGYLMQFLRDRPECFRVQRSRTLEDAVFGTPPKCIYQDPECSCNFEAILHEGESDFGLNLDDAADDNLMVLLARKCCEHGGVTGSTRVPLPRLGRDPDVKKALKGRTLLNELERDGCWRACRGLPPRFIWDSHSSAFTVGVHPKWLSECGLEVKPAKKGARAEAKPGRRMQATCDTVEILIERPGIIAVVKKPGITSEAMLEALQIQLDAKHGSDVLKVISVSRLDRDTSGILVAATSAEGAECLTEQFRERRVSKRYLSLCVGHVAKLQGDVTARLYISGFSEKYRAYVSPKGKDAHTRYQVVGRYRRAKRGSTEMAQGMSSASGEFASISEKTELQTPIRHYILKRSRESTSDLGELFESQEYTLLDCYPITGRTHQIRAHMQHCGHPLVADANYNPRGQVRQHFGWCPRLFLHCRAMRFRDLANKEIELELPLPEDLSKVVSSLHSID